MKRYKKLLAIFAVALLMMGVMTTSVQAATPRTMLTYDVWGYTKLERVGLKARITVNDSENIIVGTQGIVTHYWTPEIKEETIKWTSLAISYDGSYAYCAVSYSDVFGNSHTETVKFYP